MNLGIYRFLRRDSGDLEGLGSQFWLILDRGFENSKLTVLNIKYQTE